MYLISMHNSRPKFALIGHPTDLPLFRAYINHLKPEKTFRDELILKLFEWTPSYKASDWENVSLDGKIFGDGILIMVPFLPEMRDIKLAAVIKKVEDAISIAASEGCRVAALGAFTSIVLQGREDELAAKYNITLTSGNSTTAALIIHSIEKLLARSGRDLSNETIAIIGASGDIGRGVVLWFGNKVKRLLLTARNKALLDNIVADYSNKLTCTVETSTDNMAAIKAAGVSIFVTSAYTALCSQNDFPVRAIVCDASAPLNVQFAPPLRTDITLFHGGIAALPCSLDPGFDIGLAAPHHLYGCMTEGMLMAFNDSLPPSLGRGNITVEKIQCYMNELDRLKIVPAYSTGKTIIFT
jgi:fatty aldehyde-generating acyl-ACP reductase